MPAGAVRVEGKGKFLMPGLAEMHAHIPGGAATNQAVERTLFLYAANGVTTIRGMLGDPRHLEYRDRAAKGEIVSPLIYTSGPSFNAKTAATMPMAVEAVIAQKKAGYDLLKIHPGVPRDVFDALAAKADELKIPFAGHVPAAVGLHRALEATLRQHRSPRRLRRGAHAEPAVDSQFFGTNLMGRGGRNQVRVARRGIEGRRRVAGSDAGADGQPVERRADRDARRAAGDEVCDSSGVDQELDLRSARSSRQIPQADRARLLGLRRRFIKALHDARCAVRAWF